jgi:hypothetical protein
MTKFQAVNRSLLTFVSFAVKKFTTKEHKEINRYKTFRRKPDSEPVQRHFYRHFWRFSTRGLTMPQCIPSMVAVAMTACVLSLSVFARLSQRGGNGIGNACWRTDGYPVNLVEKGKKIFCSRSRERHLTPLLFFF